MKTITVLTLALSLFGCSRGDSGFDQAEAREQIRGIEHSWAQVAVTGDPQVAEQIFSDDFVGVSPNGAHYTKQAFIDDTKAHPLGFVSNELNDIDLRFFGDVAVAQGDETFTTRAGDKGRFVWTDALVRKGDQWRIVAAQDAVAPAEGTAAVSSLFAGPGAQTEARRGIDATRDAYVAAWRAADVQQIAELYTENASVLYPNQPTISGRSAIVDYFKGFFGEFPQNEFELVSSEIAPRRRLRAALDDASGVRVDETYSRARTDGGDFFGRLALPC
ncbi:MAG TPA: nuclear transport factor 2 family protein [Steroidobacteraceae bacterium]|nr:nuclear transport factor 2 family protein [Steroidobacteraceae bacterium]